MYKNIIKHKKTKPNSSPARAKMKSEWTSGRLFEKKPPPKPVPKKPPLENDSIALFTW